MIRYTEHSPEVLYAADPIVQVGGRDIAELIQRAKNNPRKRIRICSHKNTQDRLHEMLIVHTRDTYVRPHKHLGKSESFHVIEGAGDVVVLDDAGKIVDVIRMGDYASGRTFYYRLAEPLYHTLLIRSEVIVFHEATNGPFNRADSLFAPWAPDDSDSAAQRQFMERLTGAVDDFLRGRGQA